MDIGSFSTSRRGGLSAAEIREIEVHRAKDRPTPWQALSAMYGCSVADLQALFAPKGDNDNAVAAPATKEREPQRRGANLWTPHALHLLKLAVEYGQTAEQIAEMIGCSRTTVNSKITDLGLKRGAA